MFNGRRYRSVLVCDLVERGRDVMQLVAVAFWVQLLLLTLRLLFVALVVVVVVVSADSHDIANDVTRTTELYTGDRNTCRRRAVCRRIFLEEKQRTKLNENKNDDVVQVWWVETSTKYTVPVGQRTGRWSRQPVGGRWMVGASGVRQKRGRTELKDGVD